MDEVTTLIATLGGQPQVITFTLDLLLARGECIDQVLVIYLAGNPRYRAAFERLAGEFAGDRYAGRLCHLRQAPVTTGQTNLSDARSPMEVEAVRSAFNLHLARLKQAGQRVHLSLTGGRRIMALTGLAAAMQHLTPADRVWHLFTPPELTEEAREGRILHAPPGSGVALVEVPFVPWVAWIPGLRPLLDSSQEDLLNLAVGWLDTQERDRCHRVWEMLTSRQQDVLRLLADGLPQKQVAQRLGIQVSTVETHSKAIHRACLQIWDEPDQRFDGHFFRTRFKPFLATLDRV